MIERIAPGIAVPGLAGTPACAAERAPAHAGWGAGSARHIAATTYLTESAAGWISGLWKMRGSL